MDMKSVKSSNIDAIGYDKKKKELYIRFRHGGVYIYSNVPERVYDKFINSPSKGIYFHNEIKKIYNFTR